MSRYKHCLVMLIACAGQVQAQSGANRPASPQDFAYERLAIPTREAAAYRFALPLAVYQNTVREDLGDLRIFNADGAVIPFSLSRPTPQSSIQKTPVPVPMFPLHDGARILLDGLRLTINSGGSALALQTQNGTSIATAAVRQYLLDARAIDSAVSALQLAWQDGAPDYTGRLSVEVSDDLAAWRSLVAAAPIANLHAAGRSLIESRVEVPVTKAKYWRLAWLGMAPGFELSGVLAEPAAGLTEPERESLEVNGSADPKSSGEYDFDLGGHPPVSRVNVLLPDPNSVVEVELSSRSTPVAPWRTIIRAGFYRLKAPDGEQQNAPLGVASDSDRYWRARVIGAGASPQSLRLHVEWVPTAVTFLAQGHAPFLLAYGNASATAAEADLSRLPNTLETAAATLAPEQLAGGASRLMAKPAPFPCMRVVLWSVLLLAVLALGFMAYRVAKEPDEVAK